MVLRSQHIKKYAAEAGFALCGVARARVLAEQAGRFSAALAVSGERVLGYLARNPARRFDPSTLLAEVRTVVVCALAYDGRQPVETPDGKISAHRRGGEYQPHVKAMLGGMLERLRADNPNLRGKVCCDTSAILEKAWAVEAGLGWIGRNSLLVSPRLGSFLLLGELLLDVECDSYDKPHTGPGCGECRRCVERCPAGALVVGRTGVGAVDTGRCVSALTIERARAKGAFVEKECPGEPAEALHGWIWGCDECQTVCPYQRKMSRR